jgi:hypothetical protein
MHPSSLEILKYTLLYFGYFRTSGTVQSELPDPSASTITNSAETSGITVRQGREGHCLRASVYTRKRFFAVIEFYFPYSPLFIELGHTYVPSLLVFFLSFWQADAFAIFDSRRLGMVAANKTPAEKRVFLLILVRLQ